MYIIRTVFKPTGL